MSISAIIKTLRARTGVDWGIPPRDFYERDTVEVTRDLLGCLLIRVEQFTAAHQAQPPTLAITGGRIVEAEAYLGEHDPAAHAARGRTAVTDIMYRHGGFAYVYKIYGMYECLNAVAEPEGTPGCVLIRALEPVFGIETMAARRKVGEEKRKALCSGPGKLCQALGIGRELNGADLTTGPLLILRPAGAGIETPVKIQHGPRVGITKAADWELRFWIEGSPWVSRA
jgi:DNA-3-methyladenine glycosylase